ncbi:DegV family protein [Bacillus spongiae]|uniref:DegV family protein n=1 Tax=Bacillus spongiae TaxID=2683610 RepID=A0ABU8HD41_9BACI
MRVAWVTDSSVHQIKQLDDIYIVPISINVNGETYYDGIDIGQEKIYELIKQDNMEIKTSQPSIGAFVDVYRECEQHYDHIISIHLSSKLSGTYYTAVQASSFVNIPITIIDSNVLSYPLLDLILYGKKLQEKGASVETIKERLEARIPHNEAYVMVGNLGQLHKSGRIKGLTFFLGSMLNIKPVLSIEAGEIIVKNRVRSKARGLKQMTSFLQKALEEATIQHAWIFHGKNETEARKWREALTERFPEVSFLTCPIGTVLSVHAGEELIGISWYKEG